MTEAYARAGAIEPFSWKSKAFSEKYLSTAHGTCGTSWVESTPIKLSATPAIVTEAAPTYGQHSFKVLTEILNYSEDRFVELAVSEVLK